MHRRQRVRAARLPDVPPGWDLRPHGEIHPPQPVAETRLGGYSFNRRRRETRTDIWITPDDGGR